MKQYIFILILIISFFVPDRLMAGSLNDNVERYVEMSSAELIEKAQKYIYSGCQQDSALLFYTIVANRYSKDMSREDQERCIDAFIGKWYVYFFIHFDYNNSYENLVKARDIATCINSRLPKINMNFGCMYQAIAEQSKDRQLYNISYSHFIDAINAAISDNDENILNISFTNLMSVADDIDSLDNVREMWGRYSAYKFKKNHPLVEFNRNMYKAVTFSKEKKYEEALGCYDKMINITDGRKGFTRFLFIAYVKKAGIYLDMQKTNELFDLLDVMMKISESQEMKDARLIVYELYARAYKQKKCYKELEENRDKYFALKDSLISYRQIATMDKIDFVNDIKEVDDKLEKLKINNAFNKRMIYIESIFLFIILFFAVVVIKKNSQLKKTNRELYNKNVLLLKSEDQSKAICKKYKEANPDDHEDVTTGIGQPDLNEEERILLDEILRIMENKELICSYNFTIEKLTALANSKQRLVSELIGKMYDCNFNSFLGEYRIKEACRRFDDFENYGNLTIEGIGNSVGFKSRSNFVITFKKFTGLTPSKYKQMAESVEKNV